MQTARYIWIGRVLTVLAVLFMAFDGIIHVINPQFVSDSFVQLGYSSDLAVPLGIVELLCLALYVIPRTSVLGALLLTGYLGGAVATNVRAGTPFFTNVLFPVYVALFIWGGLYGRDERIRALVPLVKK